MDEPQKSSDPPNESLADVPPTPLMTSSAASTGCFNAVALTAAGAGALFLLAGLMTPCVGATRSAKLKWEERRAEIEQAAHDVPSESEEH
jgi:hypothetical protein